MRSYFKRTWLETVDNGYTSIRDARGESCTPDRAEWFDHDALVHGDYVGVGAIGRSNMRVILKEFAALEGEAFWIKRDRHSTESMRLHMELGGDECRAEWLELKRSIDALDDYCVADEMDCSMLESDEESEAWDNFGASDFRGALRRLAPHHDSLFDAVPDAVLYETWHTIAEKHRGGESCIHEQGGPSFPFDSSFGERAGVGRMTWPLVRSYLANAIVLHSYVSKCCSYGLTEREDHFACSKCGACSGVTRRPADASDDAA